jgi:glycosyltransferase involved in cell wall biosynthesis
MSAVLNGGPPRSRGNNETVSPVATCSLQPIELAPLPGAPMVSVLVSMYNYAKYIDECIESVVRQSYRNFELIICDDGSTDASAEAVARWSSADSRVRLVSRPHRGMGAALNSTWKECHGEIICLLDADDTFLATKIESVVLAFQSNPEVGYLIHRAFRTDERGRRRGAPAGCWKPAACCPTSRRPPTYRFDGRSGRRYSRFRTISMAMRNS